jgi:hypothetical protein
METLTPKQLSYNSEEELVKKNNSSTVTSPSQEQKNAQNEEVTIANNEKLSVTDAIAFAWKTWRSRPWFITFVPLGISIFIIIILMAIIVLPMILGSALLIFTKTVLIGNSPSTIFTVISLMLNLIFAIVVLYVIFLAESFISIFQLTFLLEVATGKFVSIKETLKKTANYSFVMQFLGGTFAYIFVVLGGLLLFIVPGIIWAIKYTFVPWLIVDKKTGIKEAFKISAEMTNGRKGELFIFSLILGLILIIPQIIIGSLVFAPLYILIGIYVYLFVSREKGRLIAPSTDYSKLAVGAVILLSVLINIINWLGEYIKNSLI